MFAVSFYGAIEWYVLVGDGETLLQDDEKLVILVLDLIGLAAFGLPAAFLVWNRPNDWMALLVAVALITSTAGPNVEVGEVFRSAFPELRTLQDLWNSALLSPLLLLLFVFPNGRFVPRWSIPVVPVFVGGAMLITLATGTPDGVFGAIFFLSFFVFAMSCQVYRFWKVSTPIERQQAKSVVLGLAGLIAGFMIYTFGVEVLSAPRDSVGLIDRAIGTSFTVIGPHFDYVAVLLAALLILALPLSFMLAILRYRLWDIDLIVKRTLVYGLLTASLAAAYFAGVVVLQGIFRGVTGQESGLAVVVSTLVVAGLFVPLRRRVQVLIDRRFYRRRYDAERTLSAFSETARDEVNLERLSGALVGAVSDTMQPAHASLWLRRTQ